MAAGYEIRTLLKYNKLYYIKHKDYPSVMWDTTYYRTGRCAHMKNADMSWGGRITLEGKTFVVTSISGNNYNLYFPDLGITVVESGSFMADMYEVIPYYSNVNDMWDKLVNA